MRGYWGGLPWREGGEREGVSVCHLGLRGKEKRKEAESYAVLRGKGEEGFERSEVERNEAAVAVV